MSDLLETLAPEFVFLVHSMDFTVIDEQEDPKCFGNAYVVLHSRVFDLMITRDRSQRFVYIRNKNDDWHYLTSVLEFVNKTYDEAYLGSPPDFTKLAAAFTKEYVIVSRIFSSFFKKLWLAKFENDKAARTMRDMDKSIQNDLIFFKTLAPELAFLVDSMGFVVIDSEEDTLNLGNAYVVLDSAAFNIRITKDGSQRYIEIQNSGSDWYQLSLVLKFVSTTYDAADLGSPPDFIKLAAALKKDFARVSGLFSRKFRRTGFPKFVKNKKAQMLKDIEIESQGDVPH